MTKAELKKYRSIKAELAELDRLAGKIDRHATDELRVQYEEKRSRLAAELLRIERAIDSLEPIERRVLRLRYIDGLAWFQVANKVSYSPQQAQRYHKDALEKLADK